MKKPSLRARRPVARPANSAKVPAQAWPKLAPAGPACGRGLGQALIVIADSESRGLCWQALEDRGFSVIAVNSGIAAVTKARQELPQLILIDAQLPDGPGLEAVGWLRSNPALKAIPVILISARPEDASCLGRCGIEAVLRQPMSATEIKRVVGKVLRRSAAFAAPSNRPRHRE